eukprot:110402-Chlamydomonas_euryale.AAC.1
MIQSFHACGCAAGGGLALDAARPQVPPAAAGAARAARCVADAASVCGAARAVGRRRSRAGRATGRDQGLWDRK